MYKRLRDLREDNDKTQKEIAEFLEVGTTQYRRWEIGENKIPTEIIIKLAKYYKVSTDYILELSDEKTIQKNKNIINSYNKIRNKNGNINF